MGESIHHDNPASTCAICGDRIGTPPFMRLSDDDALTMHLWCYAATRNEGRLAGFKDARPGANESAVAERTELEG